MTTTTELYLSIIDQTIGRRYIQHLHIFPFPNPEFGELALRALRAGLSLTIQQLPFLAGTLKADESTGSMQASYPTDIQPDHGATMLTVDHTFATDPAFAYATMEAQGFPLSMLPPRTFCPQALRNLPGLDHPYAATSALASNGHCIPFMSAQATSIPGGLVLSVYMHHTVVDGTAVGRIYDIWSGHVRRQDENRSALHVFNAESIDVSDLRVALDVVAHTSNLTNFTDLLHCPELTTVNMKRAVAPLRVGVYTVVVGILSFPESCVSGLRAELQAQTDVRISIFVTIAALLWVHITRARTANLIERGYTLTALGVAMDMRTRCEEPLAKDFIGNMALYCATEFPISSIIDAANPADVVLPVALALSSTLSSSSSSDWFTDRLHYLSSVADPSTVTPAFTLDNGPDLFITSWQYLGADCEWCIPGTSAAKASAIRKPGHVRGDGGIIILPRREGYERDYEVLVYLEEGEMTRIVESLGGFCCKVC
ncbi:hypothetical protein CC86DRAFT_386904 [Ophiobolus disseminans]|uniref:Trichothecene 3-O-acetyltransferase-like N-terminal domain-containing protein n=1 Tax=Ophiobolus disseminans TaxID=1469910 RepID=A0A6A6ZIL4_9PLEO|nr:hypothetical protein CC86DRAFT_386904 [Ophiobolus disseminans]